MKNKPKNISAKKNSSAQSSAINEPVVTQTAIAENRNISRAKLITAIVVIGFICSFLFHYLYSAQAGKNQYPYNTFLFNPADRFNDFYNIFNATKDLNPFAFSVSVYFPFTYIIMHIFNSFDPPTALALFSLLFSGFIGFYVFKNMPGSNFIQKIIPSVLLTGLSYPFLFVLDRGNLEAWIFISIAMFLFYYLKGKDILAVAFLSFAICFKLYPGVLLLLFLIDRKYLAILYAGLLSGALTIISAAMLEGGVIDSFKGQMNCLKSFSASYISGGTTGLQHSTSLYVPLKLLYYNILTKMSSYPVDYEKTFNSVYFMFALALFAVLAFIVVRYKLSLWKKVNLLIMTFVLLPQISYDYKLISLFIPLMLFMQSDDRSRYDRFYAIVFGLLLIPKDYGWIANDMSIATVLNPLLILSVIVLIVAEAIKSKDTLKLTIGGK